MKVQAELEIPDPREVYVNPKKTAVVVIDLENEFCDPKGKSYLGESAIEAVLSTARLIDRARHAGSSVIWSRSVREPQAYEFTVFHRKLFLIDPWAVEYASPLKVLYEEPVFRKSHHDCFNQTGLEDYLKQNGMVGPYWTMIVVGVGLGVCVNQAVLGFSDRDYPVVVPLDCVAPREGPAAVIPLALYGMGGYSHNITVSNSEMIHFDVSAG